MGFSRKKVFGGSLTVNQSDVFEALEESFHQNGGVCERLHVDNARVFVENVSREYFLWSTHYFHSLCIVSIKAVDVSNSKFGEVKFAIAAKRAKIPPFPNSKDCQEIRSYYTHPDSHFELLVHVINIDYIG